MKKKFIVALILAAFVGIAGLAVFLNKNHSTGDIHAGNPKDLSNQPPTLALVKIGTKYGFVDRSGKVAINPQFDYAGPFSQDLAPVRVEEKWGYINNTGTFSVNAQFEEAGPFMDGIAPVKVGLHRHDR